MTQLLEPLVPLVGKPFELLSDFHTYVIRCTCPAKTVITIIGDGVGPACPACGEQPVAKIGAPVKLGHARRLVQ
jgi:hypothetical protein